MKIGIVGLGYVGLPLAVAFAEAGTRSIGLDSDPTRVDGPERRPQPHRGRARLGARAARRAPARDRPTRGPLRLRGDRDLRADAADRLAGAGPHLPRRPPRPRSPGCCATRAARRARVDDAIPGTTREELLPRSSARASPPARDFHLAFSPERIDPGRTDFTLRTTPKLVGGLTEACTERARELYELICDEVVVLSTLEAAELSKLLENVFRSVNIAFVNELAQLCDRLGIDVWEVIDAAATKPFGFMRFDPGPGMGGHCLPVDPFYLAFKAREHDFYPEFIELAGKVNQAQPAFCAELIERALNDAGKPVRGSRILILGVSYKAGVGDIRESPALKIARLLRELGGEVSYHDPHVPELPELELASADLEEGLARRTRRRSSPPTPSSTTRRSSPRAPLVVDFRGVTRGIDAANVVRL